jgi:LAO/AO transport system kinase
LNIETTGFFNYNRQQQNIYWLEETLQQELRQRFTQNNKLQILKKELIAKINSNEITPTNAAKLLVQNFIAK